MSRYTGPRVKVMRALGVDLPGLSPKKIEKRPYPPGQHGQARKKVSEYGRRLMEKKKLCMNYGLTEGQLRRYMRQAQSSRGPAGDALLQLLERRLDNVVFRAGFARTIPAARQLVCHGHVQVNGKRVDIPSYLIRRGDTLSLRELSQELAPVVACLATPHPFETSWLKTDAPTKSATVIELPDASSVLFPLEVQLVVEFYSQKI
jgi:small subunit ribosomal protein S4